MDTMTLLKWPVATLIKAVRNHTVKRASVAVTTALVYTENAIRSGRLALFGREPTSDTAPIDTLHHIAEDMEFLHDGDVEEIYAALRSRFPEAQ
jgi:hypothetical protein